MTRVDLVDPPAYSPPYDHALASALAAQGATVRLMTSEFAYGPVPEPAGYTRDLRFYRHARGPAGSGSRTITKLLSHLPDMWRYRRAAAEADVVHVQWLTLPRLDLRLLPDRPLVLTIHDPLERGRRRAPIAASAFDRVDAVVVHSQYAREQVIAQHGLDPRRVHVIRHGALGTTAGEKCTPTVYSSPRDHDDPPENDLPENDLPENDLPENDLPENDPPENDPPENDPPASGAATASLPPELPQTDLPVVLCFGLIRPYKGIDRLLEAWRGITGAELWIVGRPMIDLTTLRAAAPPNVRFVSRFVGEAEVAAIFTRADIAVLPYERGERFGFSGVLARALGAGKAIVLSDVGGLAEAALAGPDPASPAARLVPAGDPQALHEALSALIADPQARARLAGAARHAAATSYSWEAAARETLALYARIGVA